jgi:hypothetical protein
MLHAMQRLREHCQLVVVWWLAAAVLGVACASNEASTPSTPTESREDEIVVDVSESELDRTSADIASAYQQDILSDGRITFSEYEQAVLQMVACAADGGARLSTGTLRLLANDVYFRAFAWDPADAAEASAAVEACGQDYTSVVGDIWSKARLGIIPQSTYDEAGRWFWTCIEESGIDLGDQPRTRATARQLWDQAGGADIYFKCQDGVLDTFGIAGFGG